MVRWKKLFGIDNQDQTDFRDEIRRLLPTTNGEAIPSALPPVEVTKVALRLKYLIEQVIPCEIEEFKVTKANSPVITRNVMHTALEAGGKEYKACVVYGLLVCHRWFKKQALLELWDADLHDVRRVACDILAKRIIEAEEDDAFLLQNLLLQRFSIVIQNEVTEPANAVERAVDIHALNTIGSSGYQKCVNHLWRGWLIQDDEFPSNYIPWDKKTNMKYWDHFDPDRMRVPKYQNAVQIFFSLMYLALYTGAINTINSTGDLDVVEGVVYLMTAGFIFDEAAKFWKVGRYYIGFWNVFNNILYALLTISFALRMVALAHALGSSDRGKFNELSYNFLAFTAPMFWMRILLYLDTYRFFGAMLVVLKVMMKESLIFFLLLIIVMVGFLQAFVGMDQVDSNAKATSFIVKAMLNSVMQSPDFDGFQNFAPPFGITLYYIFTFVVMVVLLNILIALYNSAYEDITDNAIDEYMALFSQKTLRFVRAPDENVFIAPFNLVEIFCLIVPFEWWLPREKYERLNNHVMAVIYSPLLLVTAWLETREAEKIRWNRRRGEEDEDTVEEWEHMDGECDWEGEGWAKLVENNKPNVVAGEGEIQARETREQVMDAKGKIEELKEILESMKEKKD